MRFNRGSRRGFGRPSYGGRGQGWSDIPKPVKVGEEYDVEITEIGSKGDGITRIKNFIVFVEGAKKGDKIRIKITEVMNRFAIGQKVGETSSAETPSEPSEEVQEEQAEDETEETSEESSEVTEEVEEQPEETEKAVEEEPSEESEKEAETVEE